MNILLVGDRQNSRGLLQLLLEKSKHRLERKSLESFPEPDLEAYDMVFISFPLRQGGGDKAFPYPAFIKPCI